MNLLGVALALGMAWAIIAATTQYQVTATVTVKDQVLDRLKYTPAGVFDSKEDCEAFLAKQDPRFVRDTEALQATALNVSPDAKVEVSCSEVVQ